MKHYIGEIGTRVLIEVENSEIESYDSLYLNVKKPDGTTEKWDAIVVSGIYILHTAASGDFDQAGTYYIQPYVSMSGWSGLGETDTFEIHRYYC